MSQSTIHRIHNRHFENSLVKTINEFRNKPNFGNARMVRNMYEKTILEHATNTKNLKRKDIIEYSMKNFGASIIVNNLDEAFEIANEIAPEHLEVLTEDPIAKLPKIKNAGSIFLGENSPEPLRRLYEWNKSRFTNFRNSKILFRTWCILFCKIFIL